MATWMVHLRVAEQMLEVFPRLERQEFIAGKNGLPMEKRRNPFSSDTMCTCLRMSCGAMKWYIRR